MSKTYRATTAKDRYLTFKLAKEQYGVEILSVKEIIGYQTPVQIPRSPEAVLGVINLRGVIVPIIDLRAKLGIETQKIDKYTAVIISTLHGVNLGFVVDGVDDVVNIPEIDSSMQFSSEIDTTFLKGIAKSEKQVVMILDLEKIFNPNETKNLEALAS